MKELPLDIQPKCIHCAHFGKDVDKNRTEDDKPACSAFPKGIPEEILNAEIFHDKPYKGDNGIQFKDNEKFIAEELAEDFKDVFSSEEISDFLGK